MREGQSHGSVSEREVVSSENRHPEIGRVMGISAKIMTLWLTAMHAWVAFVTELPYIQMVAFIFGETFNSIASWNLSFPIM